MGGDGFGYRPRIRLMDQQLHLDPDIQRTIAEIQARSSAGELLEQWRKPDFRLFLSQWPSILTPPASALMPSLPSAAAPAYTPGAGPSTPRPGEVSDVVGALYKLPAVQRLVEQAHDEGMRQLGVLRSEWNQAGTGDKVAMVTFSTVVVGSMVTAVMANQPSRDAVLGLIRGKDIPIPGVDGLSFVVLDRGGGVTAPLGVPGLSASARLTVPAGQDANFGVTVNLDLMKLVGR